MQAVSPMISLNGLPFINPWKGVDDALAFWGSFVDSVSTSIIQTLRRHANASVLSPTDRAQEQFNQVQWLLYQRHLKRYGCRPKVPPRQECERFTRWSDRHSKHFRQLLALYQVDWFKRYADIAEKTSAARSQQRPNRRLLEGLLMEIECHLYQ